MIARAAELYKHLLEQGFVMRGYQEEDQSKDLDAEVEIHPNVVVQIGYNQEVEYGLTIEPHNKKRTNSGFRHIGYYNHLEPLIVALKNVCPETTLGTWKEILVEVISKKNEFHLKELYAALENHPKTKNTRNYREKIRQTLRDTKLFKRTASGRYAILIEEEEKPEITINFSNMALA